MTDPEIHALIADFEARLDAQDYKLRQFLKLSELAAARAGIPVSAPVPAEPEPEPEFGRLIQFPGRAS